MKADVPWIMSDKASREGDGYLARFYRHKDEVMGGIPVEKAMESRPQVGPGEEVPEEWKEFLAAANATHRSMNALKENQEDKARAAGPEAQGLYDAAVHDVDRFAGALKAWMAKHSAT